MISGTPTTAGTFTIFVVAADANNSANNSGQVQMTAQIGLQPLTINTTSVPDATRGVLYSAPLSASGGSGGYSWVLSSGTLPSGLSVIPSGAVGGTPALAATAGPYSFTVKVTDSSNSVAFQRLSLTLRNSAISLTPSSLPAGIVNGVYSSGVTASGGTGGPYTYSWSGTTPLGLGLNTSTGAITGTPTASGTFNNFTIAVSDGSQFTPTFQAQNYSITVYPVISIAPGSIPAGDALSNYTQTFTASGGSGSEYTYSINSAPSGMSFNTTGTLSGPPAGAGSFNFTITSRDGAGFTGSQIYTLVVNPALTLSPAALTSGQVGTAYSQNFTAFGGSGGYSFAFSGTAVPGLNFSGNTLGGNPSRGGTYVFSVMAKDSLGYTAAVQYTLLIANPSIIVQPGLIPSGQVGVAYSQGFTASGGNGGPYAFSITPANPFGLTFATSTATLAGSPTSFGTTTVTVTASDGTLQGHTDYSLTIAQSTLTLSPSSIPNGTVGTAYSQVFTASGGLGTYTFSIIGTQPPGLNLTPNGATATLGGTPTTGGSYSFSVQVTDGSKTATQNFTVTIGNQPITLAPGSLPAAIVNGSYSQTLVATGGNGGPYTYSITGSTPGLTLNTSTGVLSGAPTSATTYNFTIGVSDGSAFTPAFQPKNYSITVLPAITISPSTIPSAAPGVNYSQTFTASGGSGSGYSYAISVLPPGLTFNPGSGLLNGTPSGGSTSFTITAHDSAGFAGSSNYTLVVNSTVTLSPSTLSAVQTGAAYSQTFTASGGSGGYTYTFSGTSVPGLTFNAGVLSGTVTTAGTYSFSVTAKDSVGVSVTNNYSLTINNPPITLGPASLPAGIVNGSYSQTLVASGGNGGPYTYSITGSTPGLTLNTSTGVLSGAPTSATTYNFTIGVSDGSAFTTAFQPKSYSITVYPLITIAPLTIPSADPLLNYSQPFTASGGSGSGYSYTISTPTPPGLAFNASTGTLSGPPSSSGAFSFTITARDSAGFTGTSPAITLTVNPALTLSPSTLTSGQVGTGYSQAFTASGGLGGFTFSLGGTPPPGLSLNSGVLSGTPTSSGTFSFSITARDSLGGSVTNPYSLSIANPTIVVQPTAISSGQVGVFYSQVFTANGGNGGPYTFSISATALFGLSFNAATATLSGTPTSAGTSNITISATDGQSTGQRTYTLTVIPTGLTLAPSTLANGVVGVKYSQTFTASGGVGPYTITLSPPNPGGLTFAPTGATATLSGTPTTSGSFPLTAQVTDGTSTISRNYTLAISPSALSILTTSLPGGAQGVAYFANLSANGGAPPYTWAVSSGTRLPEGLLLTASGPGSGSITGTPNTPGTFSFSVTVTDFFGSTATTTLSIVVQSPPLIFTTTSPLPPALSGVKYSVTFGASGGVPPYSFSLNSGPPELSTTTFPAPSAPKAGCGGPRTTDIASSSHRRRSRVHHATV